MRRINFERVGFVITKYVIPLVCISSMALCYGLSQQLRDLRQVVVEKDTEHVKLINNLLQLPAISNPPQVTNQDTLREQADNNQLKQSSIRVDAAIGSLNDLNTNLRSGHPLSPSDYRTGLLALSEVCLAVNMESRINTNAISMSTYANMHNQSVATSKPAQ